MDEKKIVHIYDIFGHIEGIEGEVVFVRTANNVDEVRERILKEYPKLTISEIKEVI